MPANSTLRCNYLTVINIQAYYGKDEFTGMKSFIVQAQWSSFGFVTRDVGNVQIIFLLILVQTNRKGALGCGHFGRKIFGSKAASKMFVILIETLTQQSTRKYGVG